MVAASLSRLIRRLWRDATLPLDAVGIPTMLAAGGLKIFKALHQAPGTAPEHWGMVSLGTIAAAVVSFVAVKWFLRYVQSHTFEGFGWYRIALGILILVFLR